MRISLYISSSKSYNLKPTRPSYVSPPRIFILYHHPLHLKLDPLFCPSLIRTHPKVHLCTKTQIIFRGLSLSFVYQFSVLLLFQQSSFPISCNFQFSKKVAIPWRNPPFVRTLLPLLVTRLDYHLYFNREI